MIGFFGAGWGEVGLPAGSSGYPYWPVVAGSAFLAPSARRVAHALPVATLRRGFAAVAARSIAVSRRLVCCSPEYARRTGLPETIERSPTMPVSGYANAAASHLWQFEPRKAAGEVRSTVVRSRIVVNNGPFRCDALFGREA